MSLRLFSPEAIAPARSPLKYWEQITDGDPRARAIFHRHYSYRPYKDGRRPLLFVGPGEKVVLLSLTGDALFVWRKYFSKDAQTGINCAVFRNESPVQSSTLIAEAERIALDRWGACRLYTYVNAGKIRSTNPGFCFKANGWRFCGITKRRLLHILEKNITLHTS